MSRDVLDQLETLLGEVRDETWDVGYPVPREDCNRCSLHPNGRANIYEVKYLTDITHPHAHMNPDDARLICALRNNARMLIDLARKGLRGDR